MLTQNGPVGHLTMHDVKHDQYIGLGDYMLGEKINMEKAHLERILLWGVPKISVCRKNPVILPISVAIYLITSPYWFCLCRGGLLVNEIM